MKLATALALCLVASAAVPAGAAWEPTKPIEFVVPAATRGESNSAPIRPPPGPFWPQHDDASLSDSSRVITSRPSMAVGRTCKGVTIG